MRFQTWLERIWWPADLQGPAAGAERISRLISRVGMGALLLALPAVLFEWLVRLRVALYRRGWLQQRRLEVTSLVVGNRIVGGAGKTPCTLALIDAVRTLGWHPGVVSRGYGREEDELREVLPDSSQARDVGDEPLLIARRSRVPVWVGRDRHAAGLALCRAHPGVDLVICDDGLQHLRLHRDLEIIVQDERGAGNGHLLPLGPLREPLDSTSLARYRWELRNLAGPRTASATAAQRVPSGGVLEATRRLAGVVPLAAWWIDGDGARVMSWPAFKATLNGGRLLAVAGIGEPERFFSGLEAQGLAVIRCPCADHADHVDLPFETTEADVIVTEKDATKLRPDRMVRERPGSRIWVAPLTLDLPAQLLAGLDSQLRALAIRQPGTPAASQRRTLG